MDPIYVAGKAYYESQHSQEKMAERFPTLDIFEVIRHGQKVSSEEINQYYYFRNSPVKESRCGIFDESSGCILLLARNGKRCFTIITAIHYLSEEDPEKEFENYRSRMNQKMKARRNKNLRGY